MIVPKNYTNFADFEREEIRPGYRVGFSMEDLVEDSHFEAEQVVDADRNLFDERD